MATITERQTQQIERAIANRGHALTIHARWREVADPPVALVGRFA